MGGFGGTFSSSPPWRLYHKTSDLQDPGPSMTLLFWDQREDSINWGNFFIDMDGYPDKPAALAFDEDMPASYHHRAAGLAYADGRSEVHRWVDSRTMPSIRKGSNWIPNAGTIPSPNNRDIMWLQERATRKIH